MEKLSSAKFAKFLNSELKVASKIYGGGLCSYSYATAGSDPCAATSNDIGFKEDGPEM